MNFSLKCFISFGNNTKEAYDLGRSEISFIDCKNSTNDKESAKRIALFAPRYHNILFFFSPVVMIIRLYNNWRHHLKWRP